VRSVGRSLRGALILAALLLRFMVPAGFMIGTASGAPGLVLCPGVEAPAPVMTMRAHHHAPTHDPAKHREAPCPFAALAAPALPPAPPAFVPPPAQRVAAAPIPSLAAQAAPRLAAPPPPATGPPAVRI
jgi:hypothetical protein